MDKSFEDNDPPDPTVNQVVGIESDTRPFDQWVITPSQKDQGNEVDSREDTSAIP